MKAKSKRAASPISLPNHLNGNQHHFIIQDISIECTHFIMLTTYGIYKMVTDKIFCRGHFYIILAKQQPFNVSKDIHLPLTTM